MFVQIAEWEGRELDPLEYGWKNEGGMLVPRQGFTDICPAALKKVISCGCNHCDRKNCSCKTNGLYCSDACKCGDDCENQKEDDTIEDSHSLPSDDDSEIEDEIE